ncbi:guanylate kinase [Facilibium subflavum]|nr:guanylate kinase [Facilibium subflavum]
MHTGSVYIVSAPSGAGKTSLLKALVKTVRGICVCVSHTTRPPRPGETDGQDYYFVDQITFKDMINNDDFVEYAKVFDYYYGTSKKSIEALIQQGLDVILEIDWQGARQARSIFGDDCTRIFIMPPSLKVLRERLVARGQDAEHVIEKRMAQALDEASHANEYDYVVVNEDFDEALNDLKAIFRVQKLKACVNYQLI